MQPIGIIESPYKEKFGIPRQAGLARSAHGLIRIADPKGLYRYAFDGLEGFSHIWVIFIFHELGETPWKARVRPPRLGGAKKMGVYATRSPHRPNPIGISVVKLERISVGSKEIVIDVLGGDFLDGTPVLDIKPYIAYADSHPKARGGWSESLFKSTLLRVRFSKEALKVLKTSKKELKKLITETIQLDPRPAFQTKKQNLKPQQENYAFQLEEFDVHWSVEGQQAVVEMLRLRSQI
jgi:tRNA-Thr(GGU) m(6)t(6)A37 methyltransferase TsaA